MTVAGDVTEFPLPSPGVALEDIVVGPDGNLWFTETNNQNIGRINP
jgi:virginiamycin B lyase